MVLADRWKAARQAFSGALGGGKDTDFGCDRRVSDCPLADSYVATAASVAGSAAEGAAARKSAK